MRPSLVFPDSPVPTVEVDIGARIDPLPLIAASLRRIIAIFSRSKPKVVATVYVCFAPSINFGQPTDSAFLAVAGPLPLLKRINSVLAGEFRARYGDYLTCREGTPLFHIEGGAAWEVAQAGQWTVIVEATR
jgi:hypothetical protein